AGERLAAELGQVLAGGDPELRRLGLDHHRDQVRAEHDPEQQVAVLRAAGDVRREVAGVDVGSGGDVCGPAARPGPPHPARPPGSGPAQGAAPMTVSAAPGRIPSPGRYRSIAGWESETRAKVAPSPGSSSARGTVQSAARSSSAEGIGWPCGSRSGSPSVAAI